jgi:hypothetical protein
VQQAVAPQKSNKGWWRRVLRQLTLTLVGEGHQPLLLLLKPLVCIPPAGE